MENLTPLEFVKLIRAGDVALDTPYPGPETVVGKIVFAGPEWWDLFKANDKKATRAIKKRLGVVFTPADNNEAPTYGQIGDHYRQNAEDAIRIWTRRMGGNRASAEDLVQTGYTNALEGWASYDSSQPFDNWMNSILANAGKKGAKVEQERGQVEVELDDTIPDEDSPRRIVDASRVAQVREFISREKPKTQEVLNRYFFAQETHQEIAETMGYESRHSVSSVVRYFRQKYRLTE